MTGRLRFVERDVATDSRFIEGYGLVEIGRKERVLQVEVTILGEIGATNRTEWQDVPLEQEA